MGKKPPFFSYKPTIYRSRTPRSMAAKPCKHRDQQNHHQANANTEHCDHKLGAIAFE